ncbi:hypothetical protein [Pseudomonas frederiksbergensis]|uniref:hypothetical protein n=1 Tax=Pseudomonas frederiksbergensis TaxID=104087 RepID=UPI003D2355FD
MEQIASIVGAVVALSIASERLVEIIKGFIPALNAASDNQDKEARRRSYLQMLAVLSGVITAFVSKDLVPDLVMKEAGDWGILALGLLASGGSGFWNSILTYVTNAKDIKKIEANKAREGSKTKRSADAVVVSSTR